MLNAHVGPPLSHGCDIFDAARSSRALAVSATCDTAHSIARPWPVSALPVNATLVHTIDANAGGSLSAAAPPSASASRWPAIGSCFCLTPFSTSSSSTSTVSAHHGLTPDCTTSARRPSSYTGVANSGVNAARSLPSSDCRCSACAASALLASGASALAASVVASAAFVAIVPHIFCSASIWWACAGVAGVSPAYAPIVAEVFTSVRIMIAGVSAKSHSTVPVLLPAPPPAARRPSCRSCTASTRR